MKKNTYAYILEKLFLLIIVFLLVFTVVSCAPMTTIFYRPAAMDGKVVSAHCPPVESFILFEKDGVTLGAKASKTNDGLIRVTITFEVPNDKVVKLMEQQIYSLINDQIFSSSNLLGRVWVSAGRTKKFMATAPMPGKTEKRVFFKQITFYGTTNHAYYFFTGRLSVPNHESFTIKLPNFSVNGIEIKSPKVKFSQESMHYIGSLNC